MPSLWRHTRQIKEKEKEMKKCSQCRQEIEGNEYWANYYACQYSNENILCGEGECWADWMQENTFSHTIDDEEEEYDK